MQIIKKIDELRQKLAEIRKTNSLGLVPTMGALHAGHMSLVEKSITENDCTIVSIFVNPTQFGANEDLDLYPRPFEADSKLLEEAGVDFLFAPDVGEIYSPFDKTIIELRSPITKKLCGGSRPTHFRGVTTIVGKLFIMVSPDRAYFGQKDAQQLAIIRRMTKDLKFGIKIVACPIVREESGLALSSRNKYLTKEEKNRASAISESLFSVKKEIEDILSVGGTLPDAESVMGEIIQKIEVAGGYIDYVSVVDPDTLENVEFSGGDQSYMIAIAAFFGKTRLIDNILIN